MSVTQPDRVAQCVHPTRNLFGGASYVIKRDLLDPFTRQHMVELDDGQAYWAWRFKPGPAMPPMDMHRVRFD